MANKTTLSQEAAKLLEDLRTMLEHGGQFVMEQAPPLAKEIVFYGRAIETVAVLGGLMVALLSWRLLAKRGPKWYEWSDEHCAPHVGFFATSVPGIISSVIFLFNITTFCKVWFAPRLYVLQYVLSAVGGK